jgi:galactokinase
MRFEDAQKAMQQGDWKKFGKAMEELKRQLAGPSAR